MGRGRVPLGGNNLLFVGSQGEGKGTADGLASALSWGSYGQRC